MGKPEDRKAARLYYLSQGRCPSCGGKNPVIPGRVLCFECQAVHDDGYKQRRETWKAEGRCTRCGAERDDPRRKMCAKCRERMRDATRQHPEKGKERREKLRERGLCTNCGKMAAEPGRSWCKLCHARKREMSRTPENRERVKNVRQRRTDAGVCIDCGNPLEGLKWRCPACTQKQKESAQKYRIIKRIEKRAEEARRRNHV